VTDLVPFDRSLLKTADRQDVKPPPSDPLERASWLHDILCRELHCVLEDPNLSDKQRRDEVVRLAGKITSATPNHEIAIARNELRADETELKGERMEGDISRAEKKSKGSLHAAAPRRPR